MLVVQAGSNRSAVDAKQMLIQGKISEQVANNGSQPLRFYHSVLLAGVATFESMTHMQIVGVFIYFDKAGIGIQQLSGFAEPLPVNTLGNNVGTLIGN